MNKPVNIANVSKEFKLKSGRINVLKSISADFPAGKISIIIGKSGCGKTTLLRIIAGLEEPSSGAADSSGAKVGYMFQEPRLFSWLTVGDNISFSDKGADKLGVTRLLEMLGLARFEKAYPAQISGGMAQRVSLGRALYYKPDILLLDEPFASIDYFTRKALQRDLLKIHKEKEMTMIMVTHDIDEAIALADRIYVMKNGVFVHTEGLPDAASRDDVTDIEIKKRILNAVS